MKRINLNVDFDDNELFDKEVTDVIKAKIREIIRNSEYNNTIKQEIDRILSNWIIETTYHPTYGTISKLDLSIITACKEEIERLIEISTDRYITHSFLQKYISEEIHKNEENINKAVKEEVEKVLVKEVNRCLNPSVLQKAIETLIKDE